MKRTILSLVCFFFLSLLTACGQNSFTADAVGNEKAGEAFPIVSSESNSFQNRVEVEMPETEKLSVVSSTETRRTEKRIYTTHMEMQTLHFEETDEELQQLVDRFQGYFEQKDVNRYASNYRSAQYTIKVPVEQFESFSEQLSTLAHMLSSSSSVENVSDVYYDIASRLGTAQKKLERLQTLLERAESMTDIITLSSAISEAEQEVESLTGTLRGYDALVAYATISLSLREVYKISGTEEAPVNFISRIVSAFSSGISAVGTFFEELFVWIAYHFVFLIIFGCIIFFLLRSLRRSTEEKRKKKEASVLKEKQDPPNSNKQNKQ